MSTFLGNEYERLKLINKITPIMSVYNPDIDSGFLNFIHFLDLRDFFISGNLYNMTPHCREMLMNLTEVNYRVSSNLFKGQSLIK
jgi:hypothetical protein